MTTVCFKPPPMGIWYESNARLGKDQGMFDMIIANDPFLIVREYPLWAVASAIDAERDRSQTAVHQLGMALGKARR